MLLKEYAVDPEVLCSRTNWQILLPQIGASHGRLVARFPKNWKKRVHEAAQKAAKPIELAWIVERLHRLDDCTLYNRGRAGGDGSCSWLENALSEHGREPFAAIVGKEPDDHVLTIDDLADSSAWASQRQCEVRRTAKDMADAIGLLFLSGTRFKFIDPHLDPAKPRFRAPLVEFLKRIASRPSGVDKVRVECHVGTSGSQDEERRFTENFKTVMTRIIPPGLTVSLHYHPAEKMHDRFILSSWCGVDFGQGLDEGDAPPKVKVTLLEEHLRQSKWDEFSNDPALTLPKVT